MSARLGIEVKDLEGINLVRLTGVVDEDNELIEITKQITRSTALVNTADIERINSCGVRDWVTWLGDLDKKNCKIYLYECSPSIMTQVNLVNNFIGTGTIISFYAPYFCSSCEADKMLLVNVDDALKALPFRAPTARCDQCDHVMEFDDIENSYFGFLNGLKKQTTDKNVEQLIKKLASEGKKTLRTRSSTISVPNPVTPVTPSNSGISASHSGTIPSGSLKGLLTDVAPLDKQSSGTPAAAATSTGSSKMMYIIFGLLAAAIGLLVYALLRSK